VTADADADFQQVEDGLDGGKIGFGGGEPALVLKAQQDQLVQVLHLAGQLDDVLKRHADRQSVWLFGGIRGGGRPVAVIAGIAFGHDITTLRDSCSPCRGAVRVTVQARPLSDLYIRHDGTGG